MLFYNKMGEEFLKITQQNIRLRSCSDSIFKNIMKGNASYAVSADKEWRINYLPYTGRGRKIGASGDLSMW